MIARFLSNISAKYYKNPSMLSRVIAKTVGDVFFLRHSVCMYVSGYFVKEKKSVTLTDLFDSMQFLKKIDSA